MKILFYLGHPAHYHLFKNVINHLHLKGHKIKIMTKKKDILDQLLKEEGVEYINILPEGRKDSRFGIAYGLIKRNFKMLSFCIKNFKPDLLIGTSVEITHVGTLLKIPSISVNEDDFDVVPYYSKLSYPFATTILAPTSCKVGRWEHKSIHYHGYHELAYLHPNNFSPNENIVNKYFYSNKNYFILRFAKLTAHHDTGIRGINSRIALGIIDILKKKGDIYITSERKLEREFEKYRIKINPKDMHHVLYYANMYIGDSQTMAAEAGVLGTPFIRFNDFVGRIGYLDELENKYGLGFGIKPDQENLLYTQIRQLLEIKEIKTIWHERRKKMLSEKIDFNAFLIWFIEAYPISIKIMKRDPNYQFNFK